MTDTQHESGAYYWNADTDLCKHGAEPDIEADGEAWEVWSDRHPVSDDGRICLDAPAGEACLDCSAEDGEMVPWARCRIREHARPKQVVTPNASAKHEPLTVEVAGLECLERECEDFYTEDGDEIPGKDACSHMHNEEICAGCSVETDGLFEPAIPWADCPQVATTP